MSHCTLADNISCLNATEIVQLLPIKPSLPLQLINEERRKTIRGGFIRPTIQSYASKKNPPQSLQANVAFNR